MALCFLLDEQLRGPLWQAVHQHNARGVNVLDALRVGDPPAPPLGADARRLALLAEALEEGGVDTALLEHLARPGLTCVVVSR
jgi:hypothetical protein